MDGEDVIIVTVVRLLRKLESMNVSYDSQFDLLYLQFDDAATSVRNEDAGDGVVLDITPDGRLAGIEILDASRVMDLGRLFPIEYERSGSPA
ncbi:MAG: DUF2283 domain-containing protein [bacterium]